jgi:hypothetical protein
MVRHTAACEGGRQLVAAERSGCVRQLTDWDDVLPDVEAAVRGGGTGGVSVLLRFLPWS